MQGSPLITQLDSLTIASSTVTTAVRPFPCIGISPTLPTLFNASSGGKLSSVDSQDRTVSWQLAIGSQSYSAPAIIADLVFVGSTDTHLYGVSWSGGGLFNGGIVFSFPTGGAIYSGPAISNSRIYFGSTDNNIYALSLHGNCPGGASFCTGRRWRRTVSAASAPSAASSASGSRSTCSGPRPRCSRR